MSWFKKKDKEQGSAPSSETFENEETVRTEAAVPKKPAVPQPEPPKPGFIFRLRKGLSKTREILTTDIDELFTIGKKTEELLEELEERLITSDVGVEITQELIAKLSKKASRLSDANQLKEALKAEIITLLQRSAQASEKNHSGPHIVMVIGVNGVGKTTTIGKLAAKSKAGGKKVMIAAADTFRAAAIEQLTIWAERAGVDIVRHRENADPAAVAYDSVESAVARGKDIVFVDTAGRLHTKVNLMEELKKINRAISKKIPDAPHEVLLVLDATTGQNALSQARMFNEALGVTGIALTKLDGTARGGIVISICSTLNIPLKYIGVGENIEDLQDFDPVQFANALF
ncbi:MAG: signal recognition particle-docking protein FtsY [Desulfobacteraceae bacterium IS3]|nr:MAG: signal recognition particle-docking protein FtsY [Desulfobacteraceae bacterium IS3]